MCGRRASQRAADAMQVKNGRQAPAAPGPTQMKDLPDPCASALNIPKARPLHLLRSPPGVCRV